jgi:hypothetical protein
MLIFRILVLDDGALPAGARRPQRRMPAKIGEIQTQRQTGGQQIVTVLNDIRVTVDLNAGSH